MTEKSSGKRRVLTGLFANGGDAESAYQVCLERGYEIGDVNVVVSEATRKKHFAGDSDMSTELTRREAEGGELGGPAGGRLGIMVAVLAAVGAAVAVPALGIVIAGPVSVALAAAGAATVAAGLIGVLGDWGIPGPRIRRYDAGIKGGGILMMVEARSDEDVRQLAKQWKAIGGRDLYRG